MWITADLLSHIHGESSDVPPSIDVLALQALLSVGPVLVRSQHTAEDPSGSIAS
jgi:hypothetical protein